LAAGLDWGIFSPGEQNDRSETVSENQ
jgi:hypothetical protein